MILFKSKNNGVLLLLLSEDIVNPNGKIGLSSFIDNLLLHQTLIRANKGREKPPTKKYQYEKGLRIKIISKICFFVVVLRNLK